MKRSDRSLPASLVKCMDPHPRMVQWYTIFNVIADMAKVLDFFLTDPVRIFMPDLEGSLSKPMVGGKPSEGATRHP